MPEAILLGGELEAREEHTAARGRSTRRGKRRPGRPLAPVSRPRGREQRRRAAETGSRKPFPSAWVRMEALPTRLCPVSRVPKRSHWKKQRREEKKRNRARAKTTSKRAERAAEKAAQEAQAQVRKQARHLQRAAKEAASQSHPLVGLPENREEHRGGFQAPEEELRIHRACHMHLPSVPQPEKRVPVLRLSPGRLPPPHKPLHTKTRHTEDQEAPCGAAPGKTYP
jgi:Tfp pilus assembly protein FimV